MLKKLIFCTVCGAASAFAGQNSAQAEDGGFWENTPIYVGGSLFAAYRSDSDVVENGATRTPNAWDYDTGAGIGVMVGARISENWRIQFDVKHQSNGVDKLTDLYGRISEGVGRIKATYGILSAYYDLPVSWSIRPFVGLGIGRAQIKAERMGWNATDGRVCESDYAFVGQAALGASYEINEHLGVFLEYDYLKAQDVKYTTDPYGVSNKLEYASHDFGVGIRYTF